MKSLIFILLTFISLGCIAQSHHKKGVRIGSEGDTIKAVILRNDTLIFYVNQDTLYLTYGDIELGYTDEEITALIASGYIPIGNAEDLKSIDTTYVTPRTFAAGTQWETTTTTSGLSDFYLQVADIKLDSATLQDAYGATWYDNTVGWEGIGEYNSTDFTGVYDGGNLKLDSLWINAGAADNFIGLFDAVLNATIRNIRMDSVDIASTRTLTTYLGSLVGILRGDTIENVRVTGTIDADGDYIGGVVGDQRTNQTILDRISFVGDVTGDDQVGGLMGSQSFNYTLIANNIYTQGTVTGDNEIGGFFGQIKFQNISGGYDFVKNSYAAMVVTANSNGGGFAGENSNVSWINCYYDTTVAGVPDVIGDQKTQPMPTDVMKGATNYSQRVNDSLIYAGWSGYVWDFGTSNEYPIFKDLSITLSPDTINFMAAWEYFMGNPVWEDIWTPLNNEQYPVSTLR